MAHTLHIVFDAGMIAFLIVQQIEISHLDSVVKTLRHEWGMFNAARMASTVSPEKTPGMP